MGGPIHHEIDLAVFTREGAGGNGCHEPRSDALGNHIILEPFTNAGDMRDRTDRLEARHINVLPTPTAIAVPQSNQGTPRRQCRRNDIGLMPRHSNRWILRVADRSHRPTERARNQIVRAFVSVGTVLPKSRNRNHHEPRVRLGKCLEGESEFSEATYGHRLQNEVRTIRKRPKTVAAGSRFEIDHSTALVRILVNKRDADPLACERGFPPCRVARDGLDLHDLGPKVREQLSAIR